jgi:putative metalloprotease
MCHRGSNAFGFPLPVEESNVKTLFGAADPFVLGRAGEFAANTMSKRILFLILTLCFFSAGCEDTDIGMATQAGMDAVRAVSLDDEEVRRMAVEVAKQSDLKHAVAPPNNPYGRRLQRLTHDYGEFNGHKFDFKVYLSPEVNAFAMADGSIRIYSGLMDMMDDGELLFVVGHEMGHVVEKHIKKKIMLAYAGSAVRKAIAAQQGEAGVIARSALGALAESLLNAQFSQQEERAADDYGVMFLKGQGQGLQPAISALMKLAALGSDHSFLSSHPAPEARAKRLEEDALASRPAEKPSLLGRVITWLQGFWPFDKDRRTGLLGEPAASFSVAGKMPAPAAAAVRSR